MIAEVYPILRMPRATGVFDYAIPDALLPLRAGEIVSVTFRSARVNGIVARVKETSAHTRTLKPILEKKDGLVFSEKDMRFFLSFAHDSAQSVSSVLHSILPAFPKRPFACVPERIPSKRLLLPASEHAHWTQVAENLAQQHRAFAYVPDVRRMTCVITAYQRAHPTEKIVVVCPTVMDARGVYAHMKSDACFLLTGDETKGHRFAHWCAFRKRSSGVLIGTKHVLCATDEKTNVIFILRSSHPHHAHHEQNPRFDLRTLADCVAETFGTALYFLDVVPRVEEVAVWKKEAFLGSPLQEAVRVVAMNQQGRGNQHGSWLSQEALEDLTDTLENGKRAMVVCQKKHQENFSSLFPSANICVIDKDHPHRDPAANLLLVTSFYLDRVFDPFHPHPCAQVIVLDADVALFQPTYKAASEAFYEAQQWRACAHALGAACLVQTRQAEFFSTVFHQTDQFFEEELDARRLYHQPPFFDVATLTWKNQKKKWSVSFDSFVMRGLRRISESAIMEHGTADFSCIMRFPKQDRFAVCEFLLTLPDDVTIDTSGSIR